MIIDNSCSTTDKDKSSAHPSSIEKTTDKILSIIKEMAGRNIIESNSVEIPKLVRCINLLVCHIGKGKTKQTTIILEEIHNILNG